MVARLCQMKRDPMLARLNVIWNKWFSPCVLLRLVLILTTIPLRLLGLLHLPSKSFLLPLLLLLGSLLFLVLLGIIECRDTIVASSFSSSTISNKTVDTWRLSLYFLNAVPAVTAVRKS